MGEIVEVIAVSRDTFIYCDPLSFVYHPITFLVSRPNFEQREFK